MSIKLPDPLVKHDEWPDIRDGVQRDFDAIALAIPGTGGKDIEIRYGTATVTFTASQDSDLPTVNHGLGRTPVIVVATPYNVAAYANIPKVDWFGATSTTFALAARVESAITLAVTVTWIAIG
jgi:hypothetical protein